MPINNKPNPRLVKYQSLIASENTKAPHMKEITTFFFTNKKFKKWLKKGANYKFNLLVVPDQTPCAVAIPINLIAEMARTEEGTHMDAPAVPNHVKEKSTKNKTNQEVKKTASE